MLQEGEIKRVGSAESVKVDVRVIAATHRDLPRLVKTGKFRQTDLSKGSPDVVLDSFADVPGWLEGR